MIPKKACIEVKTGAHTNLAGSKHLKSYNLKSAIAMRMFGNEYL